MIKTLGISLAVATVLSISGCNSSSSNDDTITPPSGGDTTISGKVADGYLDKAKVCLDKNENGKCDTDEPNALSINGSYDLSVTTEDVGKYSVLVEVVAGQTIDADNASGDVVDKAYTLTAPKDSTGFISPITTLIREQVAQNPSLTTAQATQIVAEKLNLTTSDAKLLSDYIVNEGTDATDKKLHEVGKVTASLFAQSYDEATLNKTLTDEEKQATKSLIARKVNDEINTLATSIKNGSEASALTSNVTTIVGGMNINEQQIKTETQKIDLKKNAVVKTFADMIDIDFFHFFRDGTNLQIETWVLKNTKLYFGSKSLSTAITDGVDNITLNTEDSYTIQSDNGVVFDSTSGINGDDDIYSTIKSKVVVMDLSKKEYTVNDILYLSVSEDINDDALRPEDVASDKLNEVIPFQVGDNLIINTMLNRTTKKYYGKTIDFNKSAMNRILATMK